MRILIVGASGDVGRAAHAALAERHEVVTANRSSGDHRVNIEDRGSIDALYDAVGSLDAVISCVGNVHFGPLIELTEAQFRIALNNKIMGQINLVLAGMERLSDSGSFTLTSGVLDRDPVRLAVCSATANGALAGFVKGAALEMPRGQRINVVSPGLLTVSQSTYGHLFPGHECVPDDRVGRAYVKSVEGALTGEVIIVA